MEIHSLLGIFRESLAPFVLISGIGLLLLSMTNRLGRPIDRVRLLCKEIQTAPPEDYPFLLEEIKQLHKRAHILRVSIALATASILGVSTIVLLLFGSLVLKWGQVYVVPILFAVSLVCLMLSLVAFLADIWVTLKSLRIEIDRQLRKTSV